MDENKKATDGFSQINKKKLHHIPRTTEQQIVTKDETKRNKTGERCTPNCFEHSHRHTHTQTNKKISNGALYRRSCKRLQRNATKRMIKKER